MKTLTLILLRGPYSDELPYTAFRIAQKAHEKGYQVNVFAYLDGTYITHHKQFTKELPNVGELWSDIIKRGQFNPKLSYIACIRCTNARGITDEMANGVIIGGLYDALRWIRESDKTIALT
ncbi:MAG: DsrE family protein [Candidatus Bathyarchaeota archaeon]